MSQTERTSFLTVTDQGHNTRLDVFLSYSNSELSRSRIQSLIKNGDITVNDNISKPSHILKKGDRVVFYIPPPVTLTLEPEHIDLSIVYEDDSLLVLNKPPGVVVHPGPGHLHGTLVHGLLRHCGDLSGIGGILRPGIVHRLDKDTSGLMVIAKNDKAHICLSNQFKNGFVNKRYTALVHGIMKNDKGIIEASIARHPIKRKEMAVVSSGGRYALTLWEKISEYHNSFSLMDIVIKTGRTHQIRVHFSHIGHPVLGDPVYGYGINWWKKNILGKKGIEPVKRQMLHSGYLGFKHPDNGIYMEYNAPLPEDMISTIRTFENTQIED